MAAAEGNGLLSSAPTPVYQAASVGPNFFVEWAAQGPDDAKNIWAVYASFVATDKDTTSELLQEVTASDEGEETALVI